MKKTEQVASEESFGQILDAITDMILVKGPKSKLLWANKAFCTYYGMSNLELRGIIDAPFSEPDHTQKFVRDDAQVFNSGTVLDIPEEQVNRHDGVIRTFHTVKTPIFDNDKNVIMTVGVSRDISDRKENEENLRIERERAVYSSKMASLGEMAGGVAHELNTPLATTILLAGQCEDLLNEEKIDVDTIKSKIASIDRTAKKMAKIIAGLRTFSREGKNDAKVQAKMARIVEETLAFCRGRLEANGTKLIVDMDTTDLIVSCRVTELSQVLLNLLNNSHDAIADSKSEKWIRIEAKKVGGKVEISITDSGHGISKEQAEDIFKPFYTTKETEKGTGLGLSISKRIIESHGGTIFIDFDSPNTRFVIWL